MNVDPPFSNIITIQLQIGLEIDLFSKSISILLH